MKTPVGKYMSAVSSAYFSMVAANDAPSASSSSNNSTATPVPPLASASESIEIDTPVSFTSDRVEAGLAQKVAMNDEEYIPNETVQSTVARAKGSAETITELRDDFGRYDSEEKALVSYIGKHSRESVRLKKLALTIIGPSREKFLKEARIHEQKAASLMVVLKDLQTRMKAEIELKNAA